MQDDDHIEVFIRCAYTTRNHGLYLFAILITTEMII